MESKGKEEEREMFTKILTVHTLFHIIVTMIEHTHAHTHTQINVSTEMMGGQCIYAREIGI